MGQRRPKITCPVFTPHAIVKRFNVTGFFPVRLNGPDEDGQGPFGSQGPVIIPVHNARDSGLYSVSRRLSRSERPRKREETENLPSETYLRRIPIHWLVFAGLVTYGAVLAFITGDTGFQADDWWILSVPYWNKLPWSIWQYAIEFRRPLEGIPWLLLFPVLGFNRIAYNLVALLFLAGASLFMGMCLSKAFPGRRAFVASSMLCSFFIPTVCPLTYVFHMDNIWLCALFFWSSVVAFQRWSETEGPTRGLVLPVLLYYLSTLAYDGANFLIFLVPLFVLPCRHRNQDRDL